MSIELSRSYLMPVAEYDGRYGWKPGARVAASAAVVAERFHAIKDDAGYVHAEDVLEDARPADAPLHPEFEWDDLTAAEKFRLLQAHYLCRSLAWISTPPGATEPIVTRALVAYPPRAALPEDAGADELARVPAGTYVPIQQVLADDALRTAMVMQAAKELGWWRRKYQHLTELAELFAQIDGYLGSR